MTQVKSSYPSLKTFLLINSPPILRVFLDNTTGKYKTGKCSVDYFIEIARKYGIELGEMGQRYLKERVIQGSQEVIEYGPLIKELHLKINSELEMIQSEGRESPISSLYE